MEAEEHFRAALAFPTAKMPQIIMIYHTFFGGLIALHLYRQLGSNDDQRLKQGRELMEKLEKWSQMSSAIYENKWLLLKAEYFISIGKRGGAITLYKDCINSARDHGNIHEMALAYELLGNYYCDEGDRAHSDEYFREAHTFYEQWGATAIAKKLVYKHDLIIVPGACAKLRGRKSKSLRK